MTKRIVFSLLCAVVGMAALLTGCDSNKAEEVPASEAPKGASQAAPGAVGGPGGAPSAAGTQSAKPVAN